MEPFVGQIMLFAGTFAPVGWVICDGRLISIQDNPTLYSIIGTYYGGDGRTTFGVPDLRSRVPVGAGHAPGLNYYPLGIIAGCENVPLSESQLPVHTHGATLQATGQIMSDTNPGEDDSPAGNSLAKASTDFYSAETPTTPMHASSVAITGTVTVEHSGSGSGHLNVQPCQAINYCIALQGIYPPRP